MVLSALEKNPRIAAELAKAKEVVPEPIAPPLPALEIAAKTEPKPLPDFPEPSPEEAAVIYGFGKGVRALDDEDLPKGSKEPKAPVAEVEEEEAEEVDAKKDWRRSAMDFEIPEEDAARPALSADEDLDAAMFPSEKDVPPRHVRMREIDTEAGIVDEPVSAASKVEIPSPVPAVIEVPLVPALAAAQEEPSPIQYGRRKTDLKPDEQSLPEAVAEGVPQAVSQAIPQATPDPEPKIAHWMDMMAPIQSGSSSGDWMSALRASAVGETKPPFAVSPALQAPPAEPAEVIKAQQPVEVLPAANELPVASESSGLPSASQSAAPKAPEPEAEEPFFADDLVESEEAGSDHNLLTTAPDLPVSPSLRDPGLIEDVAVRASPDPLLVDDEPSGPSDYNTHREETSPLHSFDVPVASESAQKEEAVSARNGTHAQSSKPETIPEPEPVVASLARVESEPAGWTERIPTVPPPSREALAEIPFLMPPPPTQMHAADNGVDTATVDAVVRKVLERLGSQIQDLLSQDSLKPLVENLLENELAKKGK
jgi:hypothetical protein